jgi:MFS family permease
LSPTGTNLNRLTAFVSLLVLVDTIFYSALTPLVPYYARTTGLGAGGVGLLVAAYPVGTLLGSLPSGVFYDRFGARKTLLLAMALMSVSTLTFAWSSAAGILILARLVQGVGGSFSWTAGLATLAGAAPTEQRGRYLGLAFSAAVAGAILGPALGGLAAHLGTGPVFSAAAVLAAFLSAFAGLLPSKTDPQSVSLRQIVDVARHAGIARGLWLTTLAGIGLGTLAVLGPLRLSGLGATAGLIAASFIGGGLLEAALSPFVGRLSDRHGPRYTVARSLVVCMATFLVIPFASPRNFALVAVGLGSLGFGTLFVPAAAMVSEGGEERGTQFGLIFGLTNLVWAIGQGAASGISGFVADATSDTVPFVVVAAICLVSLISNRQGARPRDRSASPP